MWIFIRNVPVRTTKKELNHFMYKGLRGPLGFSFTRTAELKHCSILCITDKDQNTVEYHGLAEIESIDSVKTIIQRFNGKTLMGKEVEMRRYHQRTLNHDRRDLFSDVRERNVEERRMRDRRRRNLLVEQADSKYAECAP